LQRCKFAVPPLQPAGAAFVGPLGKSRLDNLLDDPVEVIVIEPN
jgi:hypothetical protein